MNQTSMQNVIPGSGAAARTNNTRVKRQKVINIGGTLVKPGEKSLVELPVANLYTNTPMHLPVHVVNGKVAGPHCLSVLPSMVMS